MYNFLFRTDRRSQSMERPYRTDTRCFRGSETLAIEQATRQKIAEMAWMMRVPEDTL
jgi:hypothetical protein